MEKKIYILMETLTNMGYLNTTVFRSNAKGLPSKIKEENNFSACKNEIYIKKYLDKKAILFGTNYKINMKDLKDKYNEKNRGVDVFDQKLSIVTIQRKTKKWYKKIILFGIDASILKTKVICDERFGEKSSVKEFKERVIQYIF